MESHQVPFGYMKFTDDKHGRSSIASFACLQESGKRWANPIVINFSPALDISQTAAHHLSSLCAIVIES